jgi:hypothetical protein
MIYVFSDECEMFADLLKSVELNKISEIGEVPNGSVVVTNIAERGIELAYENKVLSYATFIKKLESNPNF